MTPDFHSLISQMADELDQCHQLLVDDRRQRHPLADHARALLAEADGPAVPVPKEEPRIGHILRLAEIIREVDGKHDKGAAALAEAILSHPGIRSAGLTAALPEPQPVPEGPSLSDVTELFYRRMGEGSEIGFEDAIAEALARWCHPTPQPVAVSERLPGPEDCDEQGRCWLWERDCGYSGCKWALVDRTWSLSQSDEDLSVYTHWLPAHALPLPTPEAND